MTESSTGVVIVGAGPTGLMLASCLRKLGVPFVIADRKDGPTRESRALVLQARSLEIYAQLGWVDRVLREAVQAPSIVPGFRDRPFATVRFRGLGSSVTPYPALYVLEQSRNERILLDGLEAAGGSVLWKHRLSSVELPGAGGVRVRLTDDDGAQHTVSARYLVGADGASSAVRELCGIPFEGVTNESTFYVADAADVHGLVDGSVNLRFSATEFLLAFPQSGAGHHRLIGAVRTGHGESVTEESARRTQREEFGVEYGTSSWFATYRIHHRVARRFRSGPVFLAGDAAHVHSPVGGQGMNTGLQDAHNLACKLADVFSGRAPEDSLDRYEAERRPVARRLVSSTDRLFGAVTSESRFARTVRGRVLPRVAPLAAAVLPRLARAGRIFEYLSQTRIHYWMSENERRRSRGRRGRVVGRRLPWNEDNFAVLRSMDWQVHVYGDSDAQALDRLRRESGLPVHHFGTVRNPRLGGGLAVLVRPDAFVLDARPLPASVADWAVHARRAGFVSGTAPETG